MYMIKKVILQSIIYSTVFLFLVLFSFAFAQSPSNDNTLDCGPNEFLTIGSDGLECASINLDDIEIGISLSSLSPTCVNGIRKLQIIDDIQGIVPTCVDIPVCDLNQVLSYTENAFECINVDTFSGTFCGDNETLNRIEGGRYICERFQGIETPDVPGINDCGSSQAQSGIDELGNPICSNVPDRSIRVGRSLFYNVRSNNFEGIDCGNGKRDCREFLPYGSDVELHLDFVWGSRLNPDYKNEESEACNFIKRSPTSSVRYKCEFQLYRNLTLGGLAEALKTTYAYGVSHRYRGRTIRPSSGFKSSTFNRVLTINNNYEVGYFEHTYIRDDYKRLGPANAAFVRSSPFCININATHFPDGRANGSPNTVFKSTVTTGSNYKTSRSFFKQISAALGFSAKHKKFRRVETRTVFLNHTNTIRNPVRGVTRVEERRSRPYQTWIDGDKICSTRGGYRHSPSEHSHVGYDVRWAVEIMNNE